MASRDAIVAQGEKEGFRCRLRMLDDEDACVQHSGMGRRVMLHKREP